MKKITFLFLTSLLLTVAGCKTQTGYAPGSDAGYATGKVLDVRGNPVEGARIVATNARTTTKQVTGITDANGNYRIKIPSGAWKMSGELERVYHNRHFTLTLHPDHPDVFTGQDGVVCNFEWRLYGPKTGSTDRFYGGEVRINKDQHSQIADIDNIAFTFTPVSPRIDGSTADPETVSCGPQGTSHYARISDIPIGQYKITALYRPTGQRIYLRAGNDGTYSADGSVITEFNGTTRFSSCINCLTIEYTDRLSPSNSQRT